MAHASNSFAVESLKKRLEAFERSRAGLLVKKLLDDHPHFHAPGDPSIEVLEFLPSAGM